MNYYNEIDPFAIQWLRNLVQAGLLPAGDVDSRSITEVTPNDLTGYTQCHFFAGIGGWSLALQYAGWPTDEPVWTGSCPCQPFSIAGKGKGESDHRHLWPDFRRLIAARKPARVFGEQVASKDGRVWLSRVRSDLEAMGYGVGAADLCAAGVSAPHIRQRLYWVADSGSPELNWRSEPTGQCGGAFHLADRCSIGRMANAQHDGGRADEPQRGSEGGITSWGDCEKSGGMGDTIGAGSQGHAGNVSNGNEPGRNNADTAGSITTAGGDCWSDFFVIPCGDGKARRIKPGLAPLAHGIPGRVGKIRAYGNAIVPKLAAEFVSAFIEVQRQ